MAVDRTFLSAANIGIDMKKVIGKVIDALDAAVLTPNVTASAADINLLADMAATVTMTSTPASGTCATQFTFKDADAVTLAHAVAGSAYFSNSAGTAIAAATSGAVLTNGAWQDTVAGKTAAFITSAVGLLGVTVTASAGTYYISFVLPTGAIITSPAIVVN